MLTSGGSIYSALEGGTGQFKVSCLFVPLYKIQIFLLVMWMSDSCFRVMQCSAFCWDKVIMNNLTWLHLSIDTAPLINILCIHCGRAAGPEKQMRGTCPKLLTWSCSSPASISGNPFWTTSGRPEPSTRAKSLRQSWQGFDRGWTMLKSCLLTLW